MHDGIERRHARGALLRLLLLECSGVRALLGRGGRVALVDAEQVGSLRLHEVHRPLAQQVELPVRLRDQPSRHRPQLRTARRHAPHHRRQQEVHQIELLRLAALRQELESAVPRLQQTTKHR